VHEVVRCGIAIGYLIQLGQRYFSGKADQEQIAGLLVKATMTMMT
jgi:hypothetical protein